MNTYQKRLEKLQYITPDGLVFNMQNPPRKSVISKDGFGLPETNMYTNTGAYQHGVTAVAYTLEPRDLSVTFRYKNGDRDDYWRAREELANFYRISRTNPNNPQPGKLRTVYYIGATKYVRDIDCFVMGGLDFNSPNEDKWDSFGLQETIKFKAYNPVFYNPTPHVVSLVVGQNTIVYDGTWESYPSFAITGPYLNLGISNGGSSTYFVIAASIPAGEIISISLNYGSKTVVNSSTGDNWLGYLSLTSNLSNFSIVPDPLAPSKINYIDVAYDTGAGSVVMTYYDRYVSL